MEQKRPLYVVAGDYKQFVNFCRENDLSPNQDARYVSSVDSLRGARDVGARCIGTYYTRSDIREIDLALRVVGARVGYWTAED